MKIIHIVFISNVGIYIMYDFIALQLYVLQKISTDLESVSQTYPKTVRTAFAQEKKS